MKSKLALFIISIGWAFFITYIIIEYILFKPNTIKHLFMPKETSHLMVHLLVALIPIVFTFLGYFINENKKLLRAYNETEERYRDLYQNDPDGYYYTGHDGTILELNERLQEMLGYQKEEVIGKIKLADLLKDTDKEIGKTPIGNFECELIKKDGAVLPVVINTTAFYDKKGRYFKSRGIVRDISDIRKTEEKLTMSKTAFLNMLKDLDIAYKDLKKLNEDVISSFISALDAKSTWTKGHSERVTTYAVAIAREIGLSEREIETLRTAALLHDIGKLGTYDAILDKGEDLTDEEIELIKMHTIKGEEVLRPISQLKDILPVIRSHHERVDGTGYPDGLKDNEIPFFSRIIAVADTFDSMTSDRPYRPRVSREDAIRELKKFSGTQFDFEVVEAFSNIVIKNEIS
ncbi:MAG: HD domain-containing phosphohydrolase [Thermodesulfovibrionales bacterium]